MAELKDIVKKEYIENDDTLCFQTLPLSKLIILSILTGGIYNVIWAYNCWKSLKNNFGYKISPFWRGIFNVFTNFKLFSILSKYFISFKISNKGIKPILLSIMYLYLASRDLKLSVKYLKMALANTLTYYADLFLCIISLIIGIMLTVILVVIQHKINKTNKLYFPNAQENNWTRTNVIWVIICGILFVFSFLPL